jgi:hypothetical protein
MTCTVAIGPRRRWEVFDAHRAEGSCYVYDYFCPLPLLRCTARAIREGFDPGRIEASTPQCHVDSLQDTLKQPPSVARSKAGANASESCTRSAYSCTPTPCYARRWGQWRSRGTGVPTRSPTHTQTRPTQGGAHDRHCGPGLLGSGSQSIQAGGSSPDGVRRSVHVTRSFNVTCKARARHQSREVGISTSPLS